MTQASNGRSRLLLGRVSRDTRGASGPDIEMVGLWHKPGLTR